MFARDEWGAPKSDSSAAPSRYRLGSIISYKILHYIAVNDAHRFLVLANWVAMFDRSKEREDQRDQRGIGVDRER